MSDYFYTGVSKETDKIRLRFSPLGMKRLVLCAMADEFIPSKTDQLLSMDGKFILREHEDGSIWREKGTTLERVDPSLIQSIEEIDL